MDMAMTTVGTIMPGTAMTTESVFYLSRMGSGGRFSMMTRED
jgi:hypothetical protein